MAANGLAFASFGYTEVPADTLKQIVEAVPPSIGRQLARHAYYFVPLAIGEAEETLIARGFTVDLGDRATCHRDLMADEVECTFISARLMQDRFALAFEFFINIGHQLVDAAPVPRRFQELVWAQARGDIRGETSQDAYEVRARALGASTFVSFPANTPVGELGPDRTSTAGSSRFPSGKGMSLFASRDMEGARSHPANARSEATRAERVRAESARTAMAHAETEHSTAEQIAFFEAAFSDTLAIYMLSLAMDLDYADLREREYPLLAAPALAERLRMAAELFPPASGYEFSIRYRRRR